MTEQQQPNPEPERLSESDVRRVLERAIQLDKARVTQTSVDDLRQIAQELDISPAALTQALQELRQPVPAAPAPIEAAPKQPSELLGWLRTAIAGSGGYVLGLSRTHMGDVPESLFFLLIATSVLAVIDRARGADLKTHLRDVLVAWAGFGFGLLIRHAPGIGDSEFLIDPRPALSLQVALGWITSTGVGSLIMRFRKHRSTTESQRFAASGV